MTQQLTGMAIDKVALVDRGANGRQFAILKRDDAPVASPDELAALWKAADDADPVVVRKGLLAKLADFLGIGEPVVKAQTFAAIIAGRELTDALYDSWYTLEDSLWSAVWAVDANGADLSIEAKQALVGQNLDEFKAWLLAQMSDATAVAKRADSSPDARSLAAFVRKVAGSDTERATALTKAAEPLHAAIGDGGSPDPEDLTKRADAQEDAMTGEELAAITKSIGDAVSAAVAPITERLDKIEHAATPAPAAGEVAKADDAAPDGPVSNADIVKVLVGIDARLSKIEAGRSSQQSLGGQEGGVAKRRSVLGSILD